MDAEDSVNKMLFVLPVPAYLMLDPLCRSSGCFNSVEKGIGFWKPSSVLLLNMSEKFGVIMRKYGHLDADGKFKVGRRGKSEAFHDPSCTVVLVTVRFGLVFYLRAPLMVFVIVVMEGWTCL